MSFSYIDLSFCNCVYITRRNLSKFYWIDICHWDSKENYFDKKHTVFRVLCKHQDYCLLFVYYFSVCIIESVDLNVIQFTRASAWNRPRIISQTHRERDQQNSKKTKHSTDNVALLTYITTNNNSFLHLKKKLEWNLFMVNNNTHYNMRTSWLGFFFLLLSCSHCLFYLFDLILSTMILCMYT